VIDLQLEVKKLEVNLRKSREKRRMAKEKMFVT
jgi:hypothetical protein